MNLEEEDALIKKVNELIAPFGCRVTGIGPDSTGVMGDARARGPSLTIGFPSGMSTERIAEISTRITNENKDVTRVLMDILPS